MNNSPACAMVWRKQAVTLQQKLKETVMRNTDYNADILGNMISSDTSFKALQDMIKDLDLEMEDALAI
jgi:hypothetical protein